MMCYNEIFNFYIKRYSLENENFVGLEKSILLNLEKTLNIKLPKAFREVLLFFGKDFYSSLGAVHISNNSKLLEHFQSINLAFLNSWSIKNLDYDYLSKQEKDIIKNLIKNDRLFVINVAFESEQYYFIDLSDDNSPVYLQSINNPFPFCNSVVDLAIKGLQDRFVNRYNLKLNRLIFFEQKKHLNSIVKPISNDDFKELRKEVLLMEEIIVCDRIKGSLKKNNNSGNIKQ